MYSPDCSARTVSKILAILLFLFFLSAQDSFAGQVQLAWNASVDPAVTGYKVYHGTQSRAYPDVVDAKANLTQIVAELSETPPHYFAVTAYSAQGESDFSEELVCYGISVAATSHGQILPGGSLLLATGSSQTVTIVPDSGYVIGDVIVDGSSVGAVSEYTFSNLDRSHTISAVFVTNAFTVTVSLQGSGTISPSGSVSVPSGQSQTFTITPAANNTLADVRVDGISVGAPSTYTFPSVGANHTIAATFVPIPTTSYTISSSAQGSGTVSPSGSVSVPSGQSQTFSITPAANNTLADVRVDGISVGALPTYTFPSVGANHTISATFVPIATSYTISSSVQGSGTISPSGSVSVPSGQSQTYTITPAADNTIADVVVDGVSVGAVPSHNFPNISANHTIKAVFATNSAKTNFSITASVQGSGTISPSGTLNMALGKSQTYRIKAGKNNKIVDVIVDGSSVGAVSSYNFSNVSADHTITAVCAGTYKIKASIKGKGTISPPGTVSATTGQSVTYTIAPAAGYRIADVSVDGSSAGAVSSYTFSNLMASHTIKATFELVTHAISASVQGSGKISPSGTVKVADGAGKTYKISASSKQKLVDVAVDGSSVGAVSTYSFTNVTADHSIVATFAPLSYTISASAQGSGNISPAGSVALAHGNTQTYMITPTANYKVADVKVDGVSVGAVASHSFTGITANHSITATFAPITRTITASVQGSGTISPSGSTNVGIGKNQVFTVTPSVNNKIADVKVDGASIGAVSTYEFSNVAANHNIAVAFEPITCTISTAIEGGGTISPSGSVSVASGSSMSFKIAPASGYKIAGVIVDGIPAGSIADYTFTGISGNHTIQANFTSLNPLAVAEAGPMQVVKSGTSVTLNGSNSTAPGSSMASYKWTQISGPSVTLSNPAVPVCTFTAPTVIAGAALTFRLGVTTRDGLSAEDTCIVNVSGTDLPPSADAGADQTVAAYTIVTLDGSRSSSDDSAASYQWVQIAGPAVTIEYADTARASFVAPATDFEGRTLGFELTVTNSSGLKMTDQCLVTVREANVPPVADAGSDQTVYGSSTVVLDGSGSIDQGSGIVSYRWAQLSGSPVTLSDPTAPTPTFTAPDSTPGSSSLAFMLTVADAGGLRASDNCRVTVQESKLSLQAK